MTKAVIDLLIVAMQFAVQRKFRVTDLALEIQAAHDEGRDADVARFRAQADAAADALHAHLDAKTDDA